MMWTVYDINVAHKLTQKLTQIQLIYLVASEYYLINGELDMINIFSIYKEI